MTLMNIVDTVLCPLLLGDIVITWLLLRERKLERKHQCRNMSSDVPDVRRKRR